MLYLQFFVEQDRYLLPTNKIVEVAPYVRTKSMPNMPGYIVGLINYHGATIPIIDICFLLIGRPSTKKLSTRIVVIKGEKVAGKEVTMGLLAEKSTEVLSVDNNLFSPPSVNNPDIPIIGSIAIVDGKLLTRISITSLVDKIDAKYFSVDKEQAGCA